MPFFIGVDVGTGSARVGVFDEKGVLVNSLSNEIKIHNPAPGIYEQSSINIWSTITKLVKEVTKPLDKTKIEGIAFCATCSLVATDDKGSPVSVSKDGSSDWDIVMWMDHRAENEANFINSKGHAVLQYVGGRISLEMQTPKLLWLKKNLPDSYHKTQDYFDLPDFLRWKATGVLKRSMCSIVCKWTHVHSPKEKNHWDVSYFREIGLEDCLSKIGSSFSYPSEYDWISPMAAEQLGLHPKVKVGYSLIDAHSGVLGMLGCEAKGVSPDFSKRLAIICGTSNCHMALSNNPCFVPGVWGPYYGVIIPNMYLNEGGQSAAGKLLDHVVCSHLAYGKMLAENKTHSKVLDRLESIVQQKILQCGTQLTESLHIWPDFHGNRSPLADSSLKGMISGLTLADSEESLADLYLATIQSLGYGSLFIVDEMKKSGHDFDSLVICGGLSKSKLFLQTHADILRIPVVVPQCAEPVLLGAAISAASTCVNDNLCDVAKKMGGLADLVLPKSDTFDFHSKKYSVFLEMLRDQRKYEKLMKSNTMS